MGAKLFVPCMLYALDIFLDAKLFLWTLWHVCFVHRKCCKMQSFSLDSMPGMPRACKVSPHKSFDCEEKKKHI